MDKRTREDLPARLAEAEKRMVEAIGDEGGALTRQVGRLPALAQGAGPATSSTGC